MAGKTGVDPAPHAADAGGLETIEDDLLDPSSERPMQPEYAHNAHRSIKPEYLIAVGNLHPSGLLAEREVRGRCRERSRPGLAGRLPVPRHGSTFDLAGRVAKNKPAPDNLRFHRTTACATDTAGSGTDQRPLVCQRWGGGAMLSPE